MSKQIQFTKTGSPDVLQIVDVAVPAPKAHEVQIQIHAIGLNRAEMMYREGAYVIDPVFPATLGYESWRGNSDWRWRERICHWR